jgi:hypothetical protein
MIIPPKRVKTSYHKGGGWVNLLETQNRLEVKISEDRDDPHPASECAVEVGEGMSKPIVIQRPRVPTNYSIRPGIIAVTPTHC